MYIQICDGHHHCKNEVFDPKHDNCRLCQAGALYLKKKAQLEAEMKQRGKNETTHLQ